MSEIFVDAKDHIVGRISSTIAKELMKGNFVFVVNAEKAVVSGRYSSIIKVYGERISRGDPNNGPYYPKYPDRMLKRTIRGMLPRNYTGREALKRLKVFLSIPEELKGTKFHKFKGSENKLSCAYLDLGEVSRVLSGKKIQYDN